MQGLFLLNWARSRSLQSHFLRMTKPISLLLVTCVTSPAFSKSILDLQVEKQVTQTSDEVAELELYSLSPRVNRWYLLRYKDKKSKKVYEFNLDLVDQEKVELSLKDRTSNGFSITEKIAGQDQKSSKFCKLWDAGPEEFNKKIAAVNRPYISMCEGKVFLRKKVEGQRSTKETVVEFLRDNVWGGDQITNVVKDVFYQDSMLSTAKTATVQAKDLAPADVESTLPKPAKIGAESDKLVIGFPDLGISLKDDKLQELQPGAWYPIQAHDKIFVSVIKPDLAMVDESNPITIKRLGSLDSVERSALVYSVAFDLSAFDLEFMMGTDHPRVDWSDRAAAKVREKEPDGPDGIGEISPLVTTGMVRPDEARYVKAAFAGGFKRSHGAFKWGPLAAKNRGSHYGFIENGVVFSSLVPDLASIVVGLDGKVDMLTWSKNHAQNELRHARQNGVPLVEYHADKDISVPGFLVNMWAEGNWSGSAEGRQRTVRAGACLQKSEGRDYLIYSYFSSVTPAAMARVFLSYGCRYAVHLDMNALEHTYLAVYGLKDKRISVEHLVKGMDVLDRKLDEVVVPRFIGMADNRDFFYLKEKGAK